VGTPRIPGGEWATIVKNETISQTSPPGTEISCTIEGMRRCGQSRDPRTSQKLRGTAPRWYPSRSPTPASNRDSSSGFNPDLLQPSGHKRPPRAGLAEKKNIESPPPVAAARSLMPRRLVRGRKMRIASPYAREPKDPPPVFGKVVLGARPDFRLHSHRRDSAQVRARLRIAIDPMLVLGRDPQLASWRPALWGPTDLAPRGAVLNQADSRRAHSLGDRSIVALHQATTSGPSAHSAARTSAGNQRCRRLHASKAAGNRYRITGSLSSRKACFASDRTSRGPLPFCFGLLVGEGRIHGVATDRRDLVRLMAIRPTTMRSAGASA